MIGDKETISCAPSARRFPYPLISTHPLISFLLTLRFSASSAFSAVKLFCADSLGSTHSGLRFRV